MSASREDSDADVAPTLVEQFRAAFTGTDSADAAELLPSRLMVATAAVLPADGAGLSLLSQHFRVPLGASGDDAAAVERLQFTLGDGPCLQAVAQHIEIRASEEDIARRWPSFRDEMVEHTPYRSVISIPLRITPSLPGAVDLYFTSGTGAWTIDLAAADTVVDEVRSLLRDGAVPGVPSLAEPDLMVPSWAHGASPGRRFRIWIAAGVLMYGIGVSAADGLALLRGYAYGNQQNLNDVVDAVIDGTLVPDRLRP